MGRVLFFAVWEDVQVFGLVEWRGAGESCAAREERIGGVRFLAVGVRRGDGRRAAWSIRRAARVLQKRGVEQTVFPVGYAAYEPFAARGIRPMDTTALREAAAAAIALRVMRQAQIEPRRTTVALCAAQVTRAFAAAAERLAGKVRYLQLCSARGGWELSQSLRSRFGIAAPVLRAPEGAALVLDFDGSAERPQSGIFLPLTSDTLRVCYRPLWTQERGEEPEQLLAALYASLALRAEEIEVIGVEWERASYSANIGVER